MVEPAQVVRQYRYSKDKEVLLARMKKVEGQARGIRRMIEENRYCPDIIQQLTALSRAADEVALLLLQDHIEGCVAEALQQGHGPPAAGHGQEMIQELLAVIRRTRRR